MPSIRDFSGGVLNQELQNLDNGNGVLFDCKNVLSSWNGELRKRTGTKLLRQLSGDSKIIPYRLPDGDDMIMVLRDKVINCYKFDDGGNLVPYTTTTGGSSIAFPISSWSSNTNGNWTVGAEGNNPESVISHIYDSVDTSRPRGLSYNINEFQNGWIYSFENSSNDFMFSRCKIKWTGNHYAVQSYVFRAGVDAVLQYSDDGTTWTPIKTDSSEPEISTEYIVSGVNRYSMSYYEYFISNNSHTEAHRYWRIVFTNLYSTGEITGVFGESLKITEISFTNSVTETPLVFNNCPYDNDDIDNIKWSQNYRTLTMACKGKQPYQITISGGSFSDSLFTPSDYPTMWSVLGFPACVTYYQNRLWFGGFEAFPTRVYSSEFNKADNGADFAKFSIPSPVTATSPIMADGTEITNIIENMWGGNNALYCLSADGISMIDAQGAIVATNQVEFKLRNREPVNDMIPTVKDDIMIYLGRDKRKILITDFDFVVQRFKANCISDNYNDFLQSGIKELHYIPRKSSLIYGTLEDGKWFAMLFNIDKQKNALFPFETSGIIKDVQPIKKGDETKLLILTQLPSYQYFLEEKFPQADQEIMDFMSEQEKQDYTENVLNSKQAYLDHSIKLVYESPTDVLGNLPYMAGEEIEVIADGQYLGTNTVLQDEDTGDCYIQLDAEISEAVLGYKYDSYAVLKFITPYTERKFPKEIAVNFINTGYLEVGNTFDSLKSVLNNLAESVSISNKRILMNGNYAKTLDKHAFETPYVIVRSDKGLPFIITGIDYKVDMSNYQGGV